MRVAELESLRKEYPKGARIELVKMDDIQAPPIGTKGTVVGVDDIGSIMVSWDNGSSLNVVLGEDVVKKVITTVCYGRTREWSSVTEAMQFFLVCILNSDGSEKERYERIVAGLKNGKTMCSDE